MRLRRYTMCLVWIPAAAVAAEPVDHFNRLITVVPADPLAVAPCSDYESSQEATRKRWWLATIFAGSR